MLDAMLTGMGKRLRFKAVVALAVAYAFCALAPSAALAFTDGETAAHCLTDQHGIASGHEHGGEVHVNVSATAEDSAAQPAESRDKSHAGNCCGLFCIAAVAVEPGIALAKPITASVDLFTPVGDIGGRGTDQIHRPPIS